MKPETAGLLAKAERPLADARAMLAAGIVEQGARAAYIAALSAARALIFERNGHVVKTHSGARTTFLLMLRDQAEVDPVLRTFLGQGYALKSSADYGVGDDLIQHVVAAEALENATRFVALVSRMLQPS